MNNQDKAMIKLWAEAEAKVYKKAKAEAEKAIKALTYAYMPKVNVFANDIDSYYYYTKAWHDCINNFHNDADEAVAEVDAITKAYDASVLVVKLKGLLLEADIKLAEAVDANNKASEAVVHTYDTAWAEASNKLQSHYSDESREAYADAMYLLHNAQKHHANTKMLLAKAKADKAEAEYEVAKAELIYSICIK